MYGYGWGYPYGGWGYPYGGYGGWGYNVPFDLYAGLAGFLIGGFFF